jgi:predicted transcriptional regulator
VKRLALATLNYTLAVASVGKMRDSDAGPARELVHRHAGLDSRIARLTNSRSQLPQVPPAIDQSMLDAANQAVALADDARLRECGRVGDNCRQRVAELAEATKARVPMQAAKAMADQIARIDADLRQLEDEKRGLAPPPKDVDAAAARLSKQLGRLFDLGDSPVETTADVIIGGVSALSELIGLLGPIVFVTALSTKHEPQPRQPWVWPGRWRRRVDPTPAPGVAVVENAGVARTTAAPKATKPGRITAAGVREFGSVRQWLQSRTVARPDSKVKPAAVYDGYTAWCAEQGKAPITQTAFGNTMKKELGVPYEEKNKRGFYLGIALVGTPKLVAAGVR